MGLFKASKSSSSSTRSINADNKDGGKRQGGTREDYGIGDISSEEDSKGLSPLTSYGRTIAVRYFNSFVSESVSVSDSRDEPVFKKTSDRLRADSGDGDGDLSSSSGSLSRTSTGVRSSVLRSLENSLGISNSRSESSKVRKSSEIRRPYLMDSYSRFHFQESTLLNSLSQAGLISGDLSTSSSARRKRKRKDKSWEADLSALAEDIGSKLSSR